MRLGGRSIRCESEIKAIDVVRRWQISHKCGLPLVELDHGRLE